MTDAGRGTPGSEALVPVVLLGIPLELHAAAAEHGAELQREFVLISEQLHQGEGHRLPRRLLDLVRALQDRYSAFTGEQEDRLEEAIDAGQRHLDLTFRVPADVADAARALGAMLDAADEYCREGQHLLTLATPADLVTYRRWYLREFGRQIGGAAPMSWREYAREQQLSDELERA